MSEQCHFCNTDINPFMNFGRMPRASGFLNEWEFENELFYDLKPAICPKCKLFQIVDVPNATDIFHDAYPHLTSTSSLVVQHFHRLAQLISEQFLTKRNAFVVEIGSNDGSMLEKFMHLGIKHLGVEPAGEVAKIAQSKGIKTIVEFFDANIAKTIRKEFGAADVIVGANVIAHIPDIRALAEGVRYLLKDTGTFIFEAVYLGDIIKNTSYSQIYDEHVYNFSLASVQNIFGEYDMELFDVENIKLQGGSIRCYLGSKGANKKTSQLSDLIDQEQRNEINEPETMHQFRKRCEQSRDDLVRTLDHIIDSNMSVAGYGAATKSTIILNYAKISHEKLDFIVDSTPSKQNKYSPGMHIPIKSPEYFHKNYPNYTIVFPWNHFDEISRKESAFESQGGHWILPLLSPEIY